MRGIIQPMLPRPERLSCRDFSRAFATGKVLRHPLLLLRLAPAQGIEGPAFRLRGYSSGMTARPARAAFVVPRRLARAARRNRLRRHLREFYRQCGERPGNCDLIFIATAGALEATPSMLREAVSSLLERARHEVATAARRTPPPGLTLAEG